jgi:hypothetical protein
MTRFAIFLSNEVVLLIFHASQHYGTAFRIPMISKWMIVVSGPQMIDDIRRATDDQVSFRDALVEV